METGHSMGFTCKSCNKNFEEDHLNCNYCSTLSVAVLRTAKDNRRSILCMHYIFPLCEI